MPKKGRRRETKPGQTHQIAKDKRRAIQKREAVQDETGRRKIRQIIRPKPKNEGTGESRERQNKTKAPKGIKRH